MQKKQSLVVDRLAASIEELHRTFGAWKTAMALVRSIRKQRRAENRISHLSNQMRRDIGLPERMDGPVERLFLPWKTWL